MSLLRFAEPHVYAPVDDSLVLWISGAGRGVGSRVFDLSGKGNHGTIHGACWKNTPLGHSALSFDGVDDYVEVPDSASLDITDAITVEAWVKASAQGEYRKIVTKGNNIEYVFLLSQGPHDYPTYFGVKNQSGDAKFAIYDQHLPIGRWVHLVGTYDGSNVKLYWNGVLVATEPHSGSIYTNNQPVRISGYSNGEEIFHGTIDEVRIYNRALSAEEIRELYNKTKHLFSY